MSNTPKVEKWHYPFASAQKNSFDHLAAMSKANSGFYPIGANGIWHGGVHFDGGTASAYEQNRVLCIADGEVVAYRIDAQYPRTQYFTTRASFSTGFVLVRHRLEIPPAPGAANALGGPSLSFFSLYMHLCDWAGYEADSALSRPAFWQTVTEYEVATQDTPLRLRRQPNPSGEEVATLPKGTLITVGAIEGDFREVLAVVSGTPSTALAPLSADSPRLGWVASRYLTPHGQPTPQSKDAVVVLPQPVPIKAGELIGYPGVYQQPTQAAPETMLHLEVFSCDDVPAFMAQSKAYGYWLPRAKKSVVKVAKGDRLIPHAPTFTATNPPNRFADNAWIIGSDLMLPQSYLDSLPATHRMTQRFEGGRTNTAWVIKWWRLENIVPDAQGNRIDGWFAEQDLITNCHSPWEWEGFQCIKETGTSIELHAYAFNARGLLSPEEQQNFRAQINKADEGPIVAFARLHSMIDTDGNGVLSTDEIRTALNKPWQAQVLTQLVTHYESEWFWSSKWDELDELMQHTPDEPDRQWMASKKRIQQLSWWADVAGVDGIAADGKAWHFNPLGIIGLFKLHPLFPTQNIDGIKTEIPFLKFSMEDAIDDHDYVAAASKLGCEVAAIKAVAITETGGSGSYFTEGGDNIVPSILFERHYFHQATGGVYDMAHPEISNRNQGGYGSYSIQYKKLLKAHSLNSNAALKSASWGKFQIMGMFHQNAGYDTVEEFVFDISLSEKNHLKAFVNFILADPRLARAIVAKNWGQFASVYNGPRHNGYDIKMRDNYNAIINAR